MGRRRLPPPRRPAQRQEVSDTKSV